ncbi:MAG: hypothetical protein RLN85_09890, partial [Pseudomonadales bacterium]
FYVAMLKVVTHMPISLVAYTLYEKKAHFRLSGRNGLFYTAITVLLIHIALQLFPSGNKAAIFLSGWLSFFQKSP